MKHLIILTAVAMLVGCMETNRGGAYYGRGSEVGRGGSSEWRTNEWRSNRTTNESSGAPSSSGITSGGAAGRTTTNAAMRGEAERPAEKEPPDPSTGVRHEAD